MLDTTWEGRLERTMRPIIEPPATTQCQHCGGELRLKAIEECSPELDKNIEILICVGCGCESAVSTHKVRSHSMTNRNAAVRI